MGALLHGDEHDIGDAHDAAHEGQEAQDPQESADDPLGVVHLHVVGVAVLDPNAPAVVRSHVMAQAQGPGVFLFESLVFLLGFRAVHREGDAFDLVAGVIDPFVGGLRQAQDDHLAAFLEVIRVQEPPGMHLDLVLLLVFGQHAGNLAGDRVSVQGESDARGSGLAGDVAHGGG